MIKVEVHSTRAVIRSQEPLTVGLRGAKARFSFGPDWANLIKTAVFRQGDKTVTVADIGEEVIIPWEVLTLPGVPVRIGVYGIDEDETVAIPTLWTQTAPVHPGADPGEDPSTEPTLDFWEQMLGKVGSLEQLKTDEKSSLVAAINEANRPVCLVTVYDAGDGTYTSGYNVQMIRAMMDDNVPVACYWYEKEVVLPLTGFQLRHSVTFSTVCDAAEYRVVINESGISCYVIELMENTQIPRKTSQLENDSGFLTEAPVTSVNGQTGDITLPAPVYLVTLDSSNQAEQPFADIIAAHQAGRDIRCDYKGYLLPLKGVMDDWCTFSGIVDTTSLTVLVRPSGNTIVYEHPLAKKTDLPKKVSDLENDSGYLTEAPVTSVNGQTGDVTVPTVMQVTVEDNTDGTYTIDKTYDDLEAAMKAGRSLLCYYYDDDVYLSLVAYYGTFVFSAIVDGYIYQIDIYWPGASQEKRVTLTKTNLSALPSGGVNITDDGNGNVTIG